MIVSDGGPMVEKFLFFSLFPLAPGQSALRNEAYVPRPFFIALVLFPFFFRSKTKVFPPSQRITGARGSFAWTAFPFFPFML